MPTNLHPWQLTKLHDADSNGKKKSSLWLRSTRLALHFRPLFIWLTVVHVEQWYLQHVWWIFVAAAVLTREKRWPCMLLDGAELSHPFSFTLFTHQQETRRLDRSPNRERGREEKWYNSQKRKWGKRLLFFKELRVELPIVRYEIQQKDIRGQCVFKERTALTMWKIKYVMSPKLPDAPTEGECLSPWPVERGDV